MSKEWGETYTEYIDTVSGKTLHKTSIYNGSFLYKIFYSMGNMYHREDGPAVIWYYENGNVEVETYIIRDQCHRDGEPAEILYNKDGTVDELWYYQNDNLHRTDGPAHILYNEDGTIEERYFLDDIECDILQEMVIRGLQE